MPSLRPRSILSFFFLLLLFGGGASAPFSLIQSQTTLVPAETTEEAPPAWEKLLALYTDFGLPLPPSEAPLMRIPTTWSEEDDSGKDVPVYTLGFLIKPAEAGNPPEFLIGPSRYIQEVQSDKKAAEAVNWDAVDLSKLSFDSFFLGDAFPLDPTLALAVQCQQRGLVSLARSLYEQALAVDDSYGGPVAVSTGKGPWLAHRQPVGFIGKSSDRAETRLAGIAWSYWLNELMRPETKAETVVAQWKKVLAAVPALVDEPARQALLRDLEAALVPSNAAPGSVEAEVDALVNCRLSSGTFRHSGTPDPHFQKVLLRGFAAVPALIQHLDDQRLTRSIVVGFNNFPTMPRRLGEIAGDLLQDIAGQELSRDWLARQLGRPLDKAAASEWWEKAQPRGEARYLREHVLLRDQERGREELHDPYLEIFSDRYPQALVEVYREILDKHPTVESWTLVRKISASTTIPRAEKLALFQQGAQHPHLKQRKPAIDALRELDPALADAALLLMLKDLPKEVQTEVWKSDVSGVPQLVVESQSPEVWAAFVAAAQRAHVSVRLELMNPLNYTYIENRQRTQRLQTLAQFLEDETVRNQADDEELYDGPCAGFEFERISVRDFASMQMSSILQMRVEPDEHWTAEQWADLRTAVKAAWARERDEPR